MSGAETTEIGVRPWTENDYSLMVRLLGDPVMTMHLGGPESPERMKSRLANYVQIDATTNDQMFVIVVGAEQIAAGSVGYWEKEWNGEVVWETGWSVLPEFQGQGIATRATAAIIELVRNNGKHRFMHAYPAIDNKASNAICRKLGFVHTGEYDFEYPRGNFMRCNDWVLDLMPAMQFVAN
jgi:RimJ/RimL family protein N-acetyltransferase